MKNQRNNGICRQSTVDGRLLLVFLIFLPFLQGCSLLFVAQGGTRLLEKPGEKAPQALSLSKEMNRPLAIEYKVKEGDTFLTIAQGYYGDSSKGRQLARRNHLSFKKGLKAGTVLKIEAPLYFSGPKPVPLSIAKTHKPRVSKDSPLTPGGTPTPVLAPEPTPVSIAKVPRPQVNAAFAPGERLKYEIRALSVLGGYATLEVGDYTKVNGRPCVPLSVKVNSVFPLTTVYPVDDLQTSYFDTVDFISWKFQNNILEGNYRARNLELFDQLKHKLVRQHNDEPPGTVDMAPFSQDIISCIYYFRMLPLEEGQTYSVPTQSGGTNYQLIISVLKREKIAVGAGTFDCYHAKPLNQPGTLFRTKADIDMWVTADSRHIPVKIKTGIVIGSVDAELLDANLPNLSVNP